MTRLALYGIKKLADTVRPSQYELFPNLIKDDMEKLRTISTSLTKLLKQISHENEKPTEVTKLQYRLLTDFIAEL